MEFGSPSISMPGDLVIKLKRAPGGLAHQIKQL
jgi:hypothetical protein